MAVAKDKMLAPLTAKYKGKVGISKTFIDIMATQWAEDMPDDSTDEEITAHIDKNAYVFTAAIKEADTRVSNAIKQERQRAKSAIDETPKEEVNPTPTPDNPIALPADTPEYMKAVMTMLTGLAKEVNGIKSEKQTETIKDRFLKDERLAKVPDFMKNMAIPANEEGFESAVTGLVTNYTQFAKDAKIEMAGNDAPPKGAGGAGGGTGGNPPTKQATKEELDTVAASLSI